MITKSIKKENHRQRSLSAYHPPGTVPTGGAGDHGGTTAATSPHTPGLRSPDVCVSLIRGTHPFLNSYCGTRYVFIE